MLGRVAQLLSYLFHPLWIPTLLFGVIFTFTPSLATPINREAMPQMLLLIFILTGLVPLITMVVMRFPFLMLILKLRNQRHKNGLSTQRALLQLRPELARVRRNSLIHSYAMSNRAERVIPFFMITVFYLAVSVMLSRQLGWGSFFIVAMLTISFTSFIVSLITLFWKISVHSVAVSSLVGFLLAVVFVRSEMSLLIPLEACIVIAGAVMSSRLYLNVHTPPQVGWGCLAGFLISFVATYWYF